MSEPTATIPTSPTDLRLYAVILAAGSGSRLAAATGRKKQYLPFQGAPLFWRSVRTFSRYAPMRGLVLVFPPDDLPEAQALVDDLRRADDPGLPLIPAPGGHLRQDSVFCGLSALPDDCTHVLIHDAARPFATPRLIADLAEALAAGTEAVIPAVAVTDTIKVVREGRVESTPPRQDLRAVQTPQGFALDALRQAHATARAEGWEVTDDAMMLERLGRTVTVIPGEETNVKITNPQDLRLLDTPSAQPRPVVGWGYDVHRYGSGRPLVLGGVPIPGKIEVIAHSDGDVLLHALTDAILGCIGGGDIGEHFPDTDPALSGINSAILLNEILEKALNQGLTITHVDLTVVAQVPKLKPHKEAIRRNVARLLHLDDSQVNVKATTEEGLGFTGEKLGLKAVAAVAGLMSARPATSGAE